MARIVFRDANLLDGDRAARPGATVVVEGNRIAAVADGPVATEAGDEVLDLAGRTLMPGMVSGHFHTTYHDVGASALPFGLEAPPAYQAYRALANAQLALRCGFTGICGASAAFDVDASLDAAIRDGVVTGPRMVPASRDLITTGDANDTLPWWYEARAMGVVRTCDGPEEFRRATRDEVKRGARMIKVYASGGHGVLAPAHQVSLAPDELAAVVGAAHGRGARVRAHVAHRRAILECVDAGVDVIDHADGLDHECIERMAEAGTIMLPSLLLPARILELSGERPGTDTLGFTSDTGREFAHMVKVLPDAVAAGVTICVGDDFGAAIMPHGTYADELALYVEHAGIEPLEVLRWATRNGARLMGLEGEIGQIAEGRLADLVVVDGDPSIDIGVLRRGVVGVMVDGRFALDPR